MLCRCYSALVLFPRLAVNKVVLMTCKHGQEAQVTQQVIQNKKS